MGTSNGDPGRSVEREMKLGAHPTYDLPDLRDLIDRAIRLPSQRLWTTYCDTPELRLWRRRITLRHRTGEEEGSGTWTLKLPESASAGTLERIELTWAGSVEIVPSDAVRILVGIVRHSFLEVVAELETERSRVLLGTGDGHPLGELDDDRVMVHGGPRHGYRFRQIELEVAPGGDEVLGAVSERLVRAGAWGDSGTVKLARALGANAEGDYMLRLDRNSSVADLVRVSVGTAVDLLLDHDYRLRTDPRDLPARSIHQARVACRRLRSDLKSLRPLLDPVWVRATSADLKWVGSSLGRVRDADVLRGSLEAMREDHWEDSEGIALLIAHLAADRTRGVRAVDHALQSERYLLLVDRLHAAQENPPLRVQYSPRAGAKGKGVRASAVLPGMVRTSQKALHRAGARAGGHPSDQRLHRIRIKSKQARYMAELAAPVVGTSARRMALRAEDLQTVLGDHHDAVTAEHWLRARLGSGPPAADFAAGLLTADQRSLQQEGRREWRAVWRRVDKHRMQ